MNQKQTHITYNVWLDIEEFDHDTGEGEELDAPGSALATFDTYEEAWVYAEHITRLIETNSTQATGALP
jgi:hypothetical protein